MEAISSFLREDALKTCPRSAKIYGCHFLNCSPAQLIFHARPSPTPHSHFSRCSRSKGTLVPWPFAGDATSLLSPELLPCPEWQQTEARAIRRRLRMKYCSEEMECLLVTFFNSSLKNVVIYNVVNQENCSCYSSN